jgi:hypothetical protein
MVELPYLNTVSKTRLSEGKRARIITRTAQAAVYNTRLLPVVYEGRILAWMAGEPFPSRRVSWFEHRPWMLQDVDTFNRICGWTTIDDLIDEVTNNGKLRTTVYSKAFSGSPSGQAWGHLWGNRGSPAAGAFSGAAETAAQCSDTTLGALTNGGNVSPDTKHLLNVTVRNNGSADPLIFVLYDLVLKYDNCTMGNTLHTLTNGVTAARYAAAGEPGLQLMGCLTDVTASNTLSTFTYADQSGNSSTVPNATSYVNPGVGGAPTTGVTWPTCWAADMGGGTTRGILNLPMAAGDLGARSVTSYQYSGVGAGEKALLLGYPLAYMPCPVGDMFFTYDFVKQIPSVPRIFDGACLTFAVYTGASTHDNYFATIQTAWG